MSTTTDGTRLYAVEPSPSVFVSRRRFMRFGAATVAATWAGASLERRLFPESRSTDARPVEIPLSDLGVGVPKVISWRGAPVVVMRSKEDIRAYSLVCTHLGCTVRWMAAKAEFYCPCHEGRFDRFGEVISGPPPLPLDRLSVTVDDGKVIVGESV